MKYLVVESNDISRAGLKSLLLARGKIVEESNDYSMIVRTEPPDVMLVGLNEDNQDTAIAHFEARARAGKRANILCISASPSAEQCEALSNLGVQGYCSVAITADMLDLALSAVEKGAFFVCPLIHQKRFSTVRRRRTELGDELSPRETEVLVQLVNGSSNLEIAKHLNISIETVKAHVKSILAKLAVHDRTQAVIKAIKFGLVEYISSGINGEFKN